MVVEQSEEHLLPTSEDSSSNPIMGNVYLLYDVEKTGGNEKEDLNGPLKHYLSNSIFYLPR